MEGRLFVGYELYEIARCYLAIYPSLVRLGCDIDELTETLRVWCELGERFHLDVSLLGALKNL